MPPLFPDLHRPSPAPQPQAGAPQGSVLNQSEPEDEFFDHAQDDPTLHFYDSDDNMGDTDENAAPNAYPSNMPATHAEPTWNDFAPINPATTTTRTTKDASFFVNRLDDEVYEGAGQSLRQWIYTRVSEKLEHCMTDSLFEQQLQREYLELVLFQKRQAVIIPTSLHLVRRILRVRELWEVEYHVCICESHYWSPMPPKDWHHPDSTLSVGPSYVCPECGEKRFRTASLPKGQKKVIPQLVSVLLVLTQLRM